MRDAGHRTPDAGHRTSDIGQRISDIGHRTAKKAKIIYPPPRGVDIKIASFSRQEHQPTGTTKWATTLRFGKKS